MRLLETGEVVIGTTAAQEHRARSPTAEEVGSTAAPIHMTSSIEDTVINLEEISAAVNIEPGDDEGGVNNVQKRTANVEQSSGNGQEEEEVIPG